MLLSKEVLLNVEKNLGFHNIDETLTISDCERVFNSNHPLHSEDVIYWLDYSQITENEIKDNKSILLVNKESFNSFNSDQFKETRIIASENPKELFLAIADFFQNETIIPEIHQSAKIHPDARIGQNVFVGAGTVIDVCKIGDNTVIKDHCSIGKGVKIGNNVVVNSGSRIGFNVFGFKQNSKGEWVQHQQIAGVVIEDNVTIGSNTCINNGFLINTTIKQNAFIDSLCQVSASVIIGESTVVAAHCFIAANSRIGARCWLSPNVSIMENVKITEDVFIGIGSVVLRNIKQPCRVFGVPAKKLPS